MKEEVIEMCCSGVGVYILYLEIRQFPFRDAEQGDGPFCFHLPLPPGRNKMLGGLGGR